MHSIIDQCQTPKVSDGPAESVALRNKVMKVMPQTPDFTIHPNQATPKSYIKPTNLNILSENTCTVLMFDEKGHLVLVDNFENARAGIEITGLVSDLDIVVLKSDHMIRAKRFVKSE